MVTLGPLLRRVQLLIGRGIISLVNDAARVQGLQATFLSGETRGDVERWQGRLDLAIVIQRPALPPARYAFAWSGVI